MSDWESQLLGLVFGLAGWIVRVVLQRYFDSKKHGKGAKSDKTVHERERRRGHGHMDRDRHKITDANNNDEYGPDERPGA